MFKIDISALPRLFWGSMDRFVMTLMASPKTLRRALLHPNGGWAGFLNRNNSSVRLVSDFPNSSQNDG